MNHPLHNIFSNTMIESSSSVICFQSMRATNAKLSVLNHNPSWLSLPHDHCNGREERLRPSMYWWSRRQILIELLTNHCSSAGSMFQVGVRNLLYHFHACIHSAIGMFLSLSRWFASIKPSWNPATKIPIKFYVLALNGLMNFHSNVKHGTGSSAVRKKSFQLAVKE